MKTVPLDVAKKRAHRGGLPRGIGLRLAATLVFPAILLLCGEWIHRGKLNSTFWVDSLLVHFPSFFLSWLWLVGVYMVLVNLFGRHTAGVAGVGILVLPASIITRFKLSFRGEPFLPWDISQWKEAAAVADKSNLRLETPMWIGLGVFAVLLVVGWFLKLPTMRRYHWMLRQRIIGGCAGGVLVVGILLWFLSPTATKLVGIYPDMWMQDRYYRNHGVIAGFLTNLQQLNISAPEDYSEETMQALKQELEQLEDTAEPLWPESPSATDADAPQTPHIIYVMDEAFWDVEELPGVEFAEDPTPTLDWLESCAAVGRSYSPSFGGGTCDVEFEALTGHSVEPLPMGCKPFQQHVTHPMFSVASYLKEKGYQTKAVHGYYAKYWNRDKAYPNLGIDDFISLEDFVNPEKKRPYYWSGGLVSDAEMAREIIRQFESRTPGQPMFLHAVTMENHSTYAEGNFPEDELVQLTSVPEGLSDETVGALRDFATGVSDADAMLNTLIQYFSQVDEPVILVFWGDHYNLIGKGYELYEKTGYIEPGQYDSPKLHATPLVIWSNYQDTAIDLGTVASYDISPVMMDLYGLEKPLYFQLHTAEIPLMRARTRGMTILEDGTAVEEMTDAQAEAYQKHWLAQYDLMFGEDYLGLGPAEE